MSIEGTAQTEYASLSGKIHTFVVDKTLSISGACADAKVTGDRIDTFDKKIDEANNSVAEARREYAEAIAGMDEAAMVAAEKAARAAVDAMTAEDVDAYNKDETVADATKELFGLDANAIPNDVFTAINNKFFLLSNKMSTITVTVKDTSGKPVKGVVVNGVFDASGATAQTNDSGVINGYIGEGSQTLSISGYADILDYSETMSVASGTSYTKNITVTTRTYLKLTSSTSYKFSGNVASVDVALGGAGGAGGNVSPAKPTTGYLKNGEVPSISSGSGGKGGSVTIKEGIVPEANKIYSAIVGSGSTSSGGASSFLGVTASGGSYAGANNGGNTNRTSTTAPSAGANGTKYLYASETGTFAFGGDGGGGALGSDGQYVGSPIDCSYLSCAGGSPGGGHGGDSGEDGEQGTDGLGGGGGGGGCRYYENDGTPNASYWASDPGRGGHGCITMRIHLAA